MSQVYSIACGLPFCQSSQGKQTNFSIGLRSIAIAVGTIVAIGGSLILRGMPGISQLGHTAAWVAISAGGTLVLLGVSIKHVEYQSNVPPIGTKPSQAATLTKEQILKHFPDGCYVCITIGKVGRTTNAKTECTFNYYVRPKNGSLCEYRGLTYEQGLDCMEALSGVGEISRKELITCLVRAGCPQISIEELTRILS